MTDIITRLQDAIHLESAAIAPRTSPLIEAAKEAVGEIEALRDMLREVSDDLADEVEGHYQVIKDHPAMKLRYDRDMDSVYRARAMLGNEQSEELDFEQCEHGNPVGVCTVCFMYDQIRANGQSSDSR